VVIKDGASIAGLKIEMRPVMMAAEDIWKDHGREEGVTITAGTDGVHSAGSLHPFGYALDLRTHYWKKAEISRVANELQEALGDDYDVVIHSTHLHTEYQRILENRF
jgi:hypothetical protein